MVCSFFSSSVAFFFFLSLIPLLDIYVVHCSPNIHKALGSKPRWGKNRPEIPALVEDYKFKVIFGTVNYGNAGELSVK